MQFNRNILRLAAFSLFSFCAAPAGADNTLHLAEGVTITLPDEMHYVARSETEDFVRSPSNDESLPSDTDMKDPKRGKRLLQVKLMLEEPELKLYLFAATLNFLKDDPSKRAQLAKARQESIQNPEGYAADLDDAYSSYEGFKRLSISTRKIDAQHTMFDYRYRNQTMKMSNVAGEFTVVRFITIFGPDGAYIAMIDYPESKSAVWDAAADRIMASISFE
jgi:hypothetical protein